MDSLSVNILDIENYVVSDSNSDSSKIIGGFVFEWKSLAVVIAKL